MEKITLNGEEYPLWVVEKVFDDIFLPDYDIFYCKSCKKYYNAEDMNNEYDDLCENCYENPSDNRAYWDDINEKEDLAIEEKY